MKLALFYFALKTPALWGSEIDGSALEFCG